MDFKDNSFPESITRLSTFWKFIIALTLFRLVYIFFIPITPQEAYYWYYSQFPALSYFDHPPMAAYSIWLGTHLFGDTIFGVKFLGVFWSLGTNILLYFVTFRALQAGLPDIKRKEFYALSFLTVAMYNLSIFSHLYAITLMPDTPLLFFWILTIYFVQEVKIKENPVWWLAAGISLGLGMVSKYTALALAPAIFIACMLDSDLRKTFTTPFPYLALILSILVFSPVILWNYDHNWASFKFQFGDRAGKVKRIRLKYIQQLIISQLFILTPLIFLQFFRTTWKILKNWRELLISRFHLLTGSILIISFAAYSFYSLVKMNWLLPAYLGLFVSTILAYRFEINFKSALLKIGTYFSIFFILLSHVILLVPNMPLGEGNTWSGWSDAAQKIYLEQEKMGGPDSLFIFTNSYKSASLLKFYLPDHPNTYSENIFGRPALQFDFWPLPNNLKGKNAFYIISDRREYKPHLERVKPFFDEIKLYKKYEYVFAGSFHTRTITVYFCRNYHGL